MVELHLPVLEKEVLEYLRIRDDGVYVDATVGDGGHAEAICRLLGPSGQLVGIDWDEEAVVRAGVRLKPYQERVSLERASYTALELVLHRLGIENVDGILVDLGASTLQLMDGDRGFSIQQDGGLDMRMDKSLKATAADIINSYSADELAEIFFRYGEERWSKRIAARIVAAREKEGPISSSAELAEIVKAAIPARYRRSGGHPARRTFQALRLKVNGELENIEKLLPQATRVLKPGGRLCIIAYHSLEDRIVKNYFREMKKTCICPPDRPCICNREAILKVLTSKAVKPGEDEINDNPRSRSARLRAAERTEAEWLKAGE